MAYCTHSAASQCDNNQALVQVVQTPCGVSMLGDTHKLFGSDLREVEPVEKPGQTRIILKEPYEKCRN